MLPSQGQHLGKSWSNGKLDHGPPKGSDASQGNSPWFCVFLRQSSKVDQKLLRSLGDKRRKKHFNCCGRNGLVLSNKQCTNMADSFLTSNASLGGEVGKGKFITLSMFKACIHENGEININFDGQFHSLYSTVNDGCCS